QGRRLLSGGDHLLAAALGVRRIDVANRDKLDAVKCEVVLEVDRAHAADADEADADARQRRRGKQQRIGDGPRSRPRLACGLDGGWAERRGAERGRGPFQEIAARRVVTHRWNLESSSGSSLAGPLGPPPRSPGCRK